MGIATVKTVVNNRMAILWNTFQPIHMAIPTIADFLTISQQFYEKWDFSNCLGAIDGRHIARRSLHNQDRFTKTTKNLFSVVLQAVVDANYKYLFIKVGNYGSHSNAGTFQSLTLYRALTQHRIKISADKKLPDSQLTLTLVFVGDGAYPLMKHPMKPFPGQNLRPNKFFLIRNCHVLGLLLKTLFVLLAKNGEFYTQR